MTDLTDEELLDSNPEELEEEDLERYNELKEQALKTQGQKELVKKQKQGKEALEIISEGVEEETIKDVEVYGAELKIDTEVDEDTIDMMKKLRKYSEVEPDELDKEKVEDVKDLVFSLLGELTLDYSKEDWEDEFGDKGLTTLRYLAEEVTQPLKELKKKEKS